MKGFLLHDSRGWTLVELMVTVGVVAIVLSLGSWGMGRAINEQALRASARQLESVMKEAKLLAYEKGTTHSIVFNPNGTEYKMFRDENGDGILDTGERVLRHVSMDRGIVMSYNNQFTQRAGWKVVPFNSRGRADINAAEHTVFFQIPSGSKIIEVRINRMGRVRVYIP